jgi:hypothetical protein
MKGSGRRHECSIQKLSGLFANLTHGKSAQVAEKGERFSPKLSSNNMHDLAALPFFVMRNDIFCYFLLKCSYSNSLHLFTLMPAKPYVSAA